MHQPIRVLAISHDAYRAGAQMILLNFLRWITQQGLADVEVLLGGGGSLEEEFRQVGPIWTIKRNNRKSSSVLRRLRSLPASLFQDDEGTSPATHRCKVLSELSGALAAEFRPQVIYSNTVTNEFGSPGEPQAVIQTRTFNVVRYGAEMPVVLREANEQHAA